MIISEKAKAKFYAKYNIVTARENFKKDKNSKKAADKGFLTLYNSGMLLQNTFKISVSFLEAEKQVFKRLVKRFEIEARKTFQNLFTNPAYAVLRHLKNRIFKTLVKNL